MGNGQWRPLHAHLVRSGNDGVVVTGLLPVIHYSVDWWNSLHQGQTIRLFGKSSMDASMLPALIAMTLATKFWFAGSLLSRARADNLQREAAKAWVLERASETRARQDKNGDTETSR